MAAAKEPREGRAIRRPEPTAAQGAAHNNKLKDNKMQQILTQKHAVKHIKIIAQMQKNAEICSRNKGERATPHDSRPQ